MIPALVLLGYAVCVACGAPALLAPLTRRGASVRAGLAAWLAAMASVLVSAAVAIEISLRTVAANWPQLTQAVCRSVAGGACTPEVYRSALYEGGVAALAATASLLALAALYRCGRRVRRSRRQTRAHADAARMVGRALAPASGVSASGVSASGVPASGVPASAAQAPGTGRRTDAVVLDDPRPAAYCVAGRPAAIVVTSGALKVLDPPQLGAVLAHERAHLAHGHHALATLTQGLSAAFPGVPLFTRGAAEVGRLTEMAADDAATRTSGRQALVAALIAIATGTDIPTSGVTTSGINEASRTALTPSRALAAAAHAVPARVERLLRPAAPVKSAACTAALTLALALLAVVPVVLTSLTPW